MIDNTNTKKEIITEILALAKYLKKNQLFNMNRSASSLDQDNKQELIDLHRRMVAVISGDIIKRGKEGEVPELKELADEYNTKHNEIHDKLAESKNKYVNEVEDLIKSWLGYDLDVRVGGTCVTLRMPGESHIDISIYYRDNWYDKDNKQGSLELNHPCWGSWDPRDPENHDAVRFFQVINNIISDPNWEHWDTLRDMMRKNKEADTEVYRANDKLDDEYHDKASVIAGEMVIKNYDEYIK